MSEFAQEFIFKIKTVVKHTHQIYYLCFRYHKRNILVTRSFF